MSRSSETWVHTQRDKMNVYSLVIANTVRKNKDAYHLENYLIVAESCPSKDWYYVNPRSPFFNNPDNMNWLNVCFLPASEAIDKVVANGVAGDKPHCAWKYNDYELEINVILIEAVMAKSAGDDSQAAMQAQVDKDNHAPEPKAQVPDKNDDPEITILGDFPQKQE